MENFDNNFQTKILTSLITDKSFLNTTYDILSDDMFDHADSKFLIKNIIEYFIKYKTIPTPEALKVIYDEITSEELKISVRTRIKEIYTQVESDDLQFVKDKTIEFCKDQAVRNALIDSINLVESRRYDEILTLITNAVNAGFEKDFGLVYTDEDVATRFSEEPRNPIPTGYKLLDNMMQGGLSAGELGVGIAKSGHGKSWALISMANHAISLGYNAIYYTLELSEKYVSQRFDANLMQISQSYVGNKLDQLIIKVNGIDGNLVIKQYPPDVATIHTIEAHYEMIKAHLFKPDIIFLDYADLLKDIVTRDKREDLIIGDTYKAIRKMAVEKEIPIWTVSQAGRGDKTSKYTTGEDVSDSYQKIGISDFIFSITRTIKDKLLNRAKIHISKNRFGDDGITFIANTDLSYGKMEIYDSYNEDNDGNENRTMEERSIQSKYKEILKKNKF